MYYLILLNYYNVLTFLYVNSFPLQDISPYYNTICPINIFWI